MGNADVTRESNYDVFKKDALRRLLTYDQEKISRRLGLDCDETYIYITFLGREYRIHRQEPLMEYKNDLPGENAGDAWIEADSNAVMTICDLLCHTDKPIELSGTFTTLDSLNRVKAGTSGVLGNGFYQKRAEYYDRHLPQLKRAFEALGSIAEGKGDASYTVPVFGPVSLRISFYQSDDEFPAQLTFFYDQNICEYMFYETLWYLNLLVTDRLNELIQTGV